MTPPGQSVAAHESSLFAVDDQLARRQRLERIAKGVLLAAGSFAVFMLAVLLWRLTADGIAGVVNAEFWTQRYLPSGIRNGTAGMLDALYASLIILILTLAFAVPVGTAAGIYLEEYARPGRLVNIINAAVSNLAGVPSIVFGLLGLAVFVRLFALGASYVAAALTMATLILPMIIVSTQEALKTVPEAVRHASYGLGASKWQTIRHHVLPYSLPGILTGQILALSRAAGETAPLLIIGLPIFQSILGFGPMDSGAPLQLRIYFLASDPRSAAIQLAAGGIVVLLAVTLLLNLAAIVVRQRINARIKW